METAATVSSKIAGPSGPAIDSPAEPAYLEQLCNAVESTDWDERLCSTPWIDRISLCIIGLSLFFLIPVLAPLLFR